MIYETEEEAREDWEVEREAFGYQGSEYDLAPAEQVPLRYWVDVAGGLPVVRDRRHRDAVVWRDITIEGAERVALEWEMGLRPWSL